MTLFLLASAGGAIGAGARYLVGIAAAAWVGFAFPWGTLVVNVVGSFLMGIVVETIALRCGGSVELRTFLATGILGGFTTFSAFSLEVVALAERKQPGLAIAYVAASVLLSILALIAGTALTRSACS
ncbi:MAG TPA: fluoride efflux transporter CrcB [Hyphomicrobiaceae bacterium]|nr:fluoride efflux transporter CrcB [Hyphomicrobiaceae bacterium]